MEHNKKKEEVQALLTNKFEWRHYNLIPGIIIHLKWSAMRCVLTRNPNSRRFGFFVLLRSVFFSFIGFKRCSLHFVRCVKFSHNTVVNRKGVYASLTHTSNCQQYNCCSTFGATRLRAVAATAKEQDREADRNMRNKNVVARRKDNF